MFRKSQRKYPACDIVIQPTDLGRFGIFDTKHDEEIEAIGYAGALKKMPEILRAVKDA